MLKASIYQRNPINLTSSGSMFSGMRLADNSVSLELSKYFELVVIGEKKRVDGKTWLKFNAPVIVLFTDKKLREEYLNYTQASTDDATIRLRKILSDNKLRKTNYLLMVERIGDTCKKYGVDSFEANVCSFTEDSYREDGKRHKFYLNVNGIKAEDTEVKDFTELYKDIKDFREKTRIVSEEEICKKRKAE